MGKTLIYSDFHKTDDQGRIILTCQGTLKDIEKQGIVFQKGLSLTFYMDDGDEDGNTDNLLANGVVDYDHINNRWVAVIDEMTFRHSSDEIATGVKSENS